MFIDAALLPLSLNVLFWLILCAICALAVLTADWRALLGTPARLHLLLGGSLFLVVLWLMSVRAIDHLWIHLLGITALTLIMGWRFTILAGTLASLVYTLLIEQPVVAMAPAWLLSVAIPASVSRWLVLALRRVKQQNLFIYMLGAGFGGGVASVLAVAVSALLLFKLIGQQAWVTEGLSNWPLISLMLFPEGFINGMIVTTLTVFYPGLMKTFDEDFYLDGP